MELLITPEVRELIEALRKNPTQSVPCVHNDSPAVAVYLAPSGCVVFPDKILQPLCLQHKSTNGVIGETGFIPLVDLSVNGQWGEIMGESFPYIMLENPETGKFTMTETAIS